jgi:hypothetical protein
LTLSALPLGDGPSADEPLGHAIAALDAHLVVLALPAAAGHETRLRRFATVLEALPAWPAKSSGAPLDQKTFGVAVRSMGNESLTFLSIANDTPYPIRLATVLEGDPSAPIDDLGRGLRLAAQPSPDGKGRQLVLDLLPFGVSAIRIDGPGVRVASVTPYPSQAVLSSLEAQFNELSIQLARLNRRLQRGRSELANPGCEPTSEPAIRRTRSRGEADEAAGSLPGGWRADEGKGVAAIIDETSPRSGRGSLKLTAAAGPASLRSGSFLPDVHSTLTVSAYLRAEPAGSGVRIWIEGEAEEGPFLRRAELTVADGWTAYAVKASDLPPGGLDSARLRFELTGPGSLWIDDVRVSEEPGSKSARLNAQRTLLAALQAYREQRYADFARLAGSHWAKHPSVLASTRSDRVLPNSNPAPGDGSSPSSASALPTDRRLR